MPSDGRTFTQSMVFSIVKYILIAVFLLSNLLMIALGVSLIVHGTNALKEVSRFSEITAILLIIYGGVYIVLGIVFSVLMNKCHPDTWIDFFLLVLMIVFLQQMVIGSRILVSTVAKTNQEHIMKRYLKALYNEARKKEKFRERIENIHKTYQCCGHSGPKDKEVKITKHTIYKSCCVKLIDKKCTLGHAYQEGCWKDIVQVHTSMFYRSASLGISFGVILGLVLMMAFYFKITYTRRPDHYVD